MRHRIRWLFALPVAGAALLAVAVGAGFWFHDRPGARGTSGTPAIPAAASASAAIPAPVAQALAMIRTGQATLARVWSYREDITAGGGSERLQYDPSRPAGSEWRVLAMNGKPPETADEQRLSSAAQAGGRAPGGLSSAPDWLAGSRYRLVGTTPDTLVYQLRPRVGTDKSDGTAALLKHLSGRLVVARDDHRPLRLRLDNFESFSPRFGVTVESFAFHTDFRRLGNDGPVVVVRTGTEARGRIFWLKSFDDRTRVVLSGFRQVESAAAR